MVMLLVYGILQQNRSFEVKLLSVASVIAALAFLVTIFVSMDAFVLIVISLLIHTSFIGIEIPRLRLILINTASH